MGIDCDWLGYVNRKKKRKKKKIRGEVLTEEEVKFQDSFKR
jgi:hypothetical protein